MVTEVVLVLDMVGKVGRAAIQYKITSIRDTFGYRTCHTYSDPLAPNKVVVWVNTISIVPAEHDQPLVTAR